MNIGEQIPSTTRLRSEFIPIKAKQITVNRFDPLYNIVIYFYDENNVCLIDSYIMNKNSYYSTYPQTLNVPPPTKFIRIDVGRNDGSGIVPTDITGKEFKIEIGSRATDWMPAVADTDSRIASLDYLKAAMTGSTEIAGGLTATNVILMKTLAGLTTGGMSGLANENIGFWTGGTYADALANLAKIILRKDGSGQLAGGKIFWDILGALNVGNFNIVKGNIIGKDTDGAERIRLSTENVPDITSLTNSYTYIASDVQTQGEFDAEVVYDSETSSYYIQIIKGVNSASVTVPLNLPYATYLVIDAGTLNFSLSGSSVSVSGMTQSIVIKNSEGATVASGNVGQQLTIPSAGTYTVIISTSLSIYDNGFEQVTGVSFTSHNDIKYTEIVRKTAIGLDGLYSYFSELEHLYFKSGVGLRYRGAIDVPAGLGGASINGSGGYVSGWGKITDSSKVVKSGSNYTITHNIGDTNYSLILTPISTNVPYYSSKSANTIVVTCAGGFDFILIRTQ
jgi:hypothetical protein